jgi:hypothetical protein
MVIVMGSYGSCNFDGLKDLKKKLSNLEEKQVDEFMEACAKELAARLLAKVIKRTPVGQYPSGSGKVGGTLRRGWTAGKNQNATSYANSLKIDHIGDTYRIEITNPIEYASYVEYGHRTRNHKGWVEGKFMMTVSEQEIQTIAPKVLENKLKKLLGECFT